MSYLMDEDIITIHLGKVVSQEKYNEIVCYIINCLNKKYPVINNMLNS